MNRVYTGYFNKDLFHGEGTLAFVQQQFEFTGAFDMGACPTKGKIKYLDEQAVEDEYEGEISREF